MSYRFVYPNGAPAVGAAPTNGYGVDPASMSAAYQNGTATNMYGGRRQRSYSPGSFSSESDSTDGYEYRGRMITRDTRCPRDVVRAPTPPPIIKRVVERAPTPEAPVMERVIIRPQAQEIVERVIEQPRTPPPRIIQKELQEEAPPPIVRTRVIKVDRPPRSGFCQPDSPYNYPYNPVSSLSNGGVGSNPYGTHSILGSVGRPYAFANAVDNNPSFSSGSSFEYAAPVPMGAPMPQPNMMTMPFGSQMQMQMQPMGVMQQQLQPVGVMQQQQPVQHMSFMQQQQAQPVSALQLQQTQMQPMMYRPAQMQSSMPQMGSHQISPLTSNYMPQNYMYSGNQGTSFGYRPMMQPGRMIPQGMPMMAAGNSIASPANPFSNQPSMFNPLAQQLVY